MKNFSNKLLILPFYFAIKFYQYIISPLLPSRCRFLPTCSNYAIEAYYKYGVITGSILTFKRLICCHPFGKSGFDPVGEHHKKTFF